MADDKTDPPDLAQNAASAAKRRRPAPTIDLKATEIASEPVTSTQPADSSEKTRADAPRSDAGAPSGSKAASGESAASAGSAPPAPGEASRGWRPEWLSAAAMNNRMSGLRAGVSDRIGLRVLGAAVVSAVAALCVAFGVWALMAPSGGDERADALAARMTVLEMKLGDLARRPAQETTPASLGDLPARIGKAEQMIAKLTELDGRVAKIEQGADRLADLDTRLARLEKALPIQAGPSPNNQALTDRLAALETALGARLDAATAAARDAKSRADEAFNAAQKNAAPVATAATDHKDIEALSARVAALEQAAKSADDRIARAAATGADKAGRLAFIALALRTAVERGDPFTAELAAARPLVGDASLLGALEPFAATGVPRGAALARELSQLASPMLNAAGAQPREAGIIDRLQQGAERLVRIRPINETPGDNPTTVISRAEVKAANGDLAGAITELSRLPDVARAPASNWIKTAEAQAAALAAARRLADNAVGGLARP